MYELTTWDLPPGETIERKQLHENRSPMRWNTRAMDDGLPQVRYARSGDVEVAYTVLGEASVDLVLVLGWLTNLEVYWEESHFRRFTQRLAGFTRLILFDKPGMGLSDRTTVGTLEERMDDVRAVMDAVGSKRAALIGISEGAPLSMLFAATHPERTEALVFAGGEVKEVIEDDWPWGQSTREEYDRFLEDFLASDSWGKPAPLFLRPEQTGRARADGVARPDGAFRSLARRSGGLHAPR